MTAAAGIEFGIEGALAAFPRRLAVLEVTRQNGRLRSGVTRRTTHVVFGRKLLLRRDTDQVAARLAAELAAGRIVLSENGFLRLLAVLPALPATGLGRAALIEQSRIAPADLDLLAAFDAFEHDRAPFSFRDLILARKYAGLIASGATWLAIARSVHRSAGPDTLTALALEAEGTEQVYARFGERLGELNGQFLLPIDRSADEELEELFARAEEAEAEGRHGEAAALYRRCLAIDPDDSVAAFNRANCLAADGRTGEAHRAYLVALRRDPGFAEAWFNLADLSKKLGRADAARNYLLQAVKQDRDFADAVYNLAALEFEAGNLGEARRWWTRYLELDRDSQWASNAAKGIRYVDLARKSVG